MQRGEEWLAAEAQRRRVRQNRISLAGIVLVFGMVPVGLLAYWYAAARDLVHGGTALVLAFVAIATSWASIFAATQVTWRCPGCRSALPTGMGYQPERVRMCEECGCRLVVDWNELDIDESRPGNLGRQRLRRQ